LLDPSFRAKVAEGIADGVSAFLPLPGEFPDTNGHWAREAILRMKEQGIVEGSNNLFAPQRPLSRAEFLAMADRLFGFTAEEDSQVLPPDEESEGEEDAVAGPEEDVTDDVYGQPPQGDGSGSGGSDIGGDPAGGDGSTDTDGSDGDPADHDGSTGTDGADSDPAPTHEFSDLHADHWGYAIVKKAMEKGYVQGYPDGTVRPDDTISRAEVSALFDRIWEHSVQTKATLSFVDVDPNSWYALAVNRLGQIGLLFGVRPNTFAPDRSMTRAEAAVLFDRFIQYQDNQSKTPL